MADKEKGLESASRGADWEVVSLTASAYVAAPGPDIPKFKGEKKGDVVDKGETSNVLFMSGHFVVPPSEHENLPLEPLTTGIFREQGGKYDASESYIEDGGKSDGKKKDDWDINKLTNSDVFREIPFFDEKGNNLAISDAEFAENITLAGLDLARKEHRSYGSARFPSFYNEASMGTSNVDDDDERALVESFESSDLALDSDIKNLRKHPEEDNHDGSGLSYAVWLKKRASSLYAQAKEANTFWSILIATAVTGLVILGQQWEQERWQVLHHRWRFQISDESIRRMVAPISRFKDALMGDNRRAFSIRGNASRER